MKILFIAAEAEPFAKTGGLGDVVGSLPLALKKLGIDVRVLLPHYGTIDSQAYGLTHAFHFKHERTFGTADVYISKTIHRQVPFYFLYSWPFFSEPYIYTDAEWDNQRFIFFAQAAMGAVWQLANDADPEAEQWWPDLIHVHDWHTGLVPFLLHATRFMPHWNQIASLISIHNMAYQGKFAGIWLDKLDLPPRDHPLLTYNDGDLLAIGLAYADKLNTVSPNHATELHYPRFGEGLEMIVWGRDRDFSGILNGIDTELLDPATDPHIFHNFNADNFRTERIQNKRRLQTLLGLPRRDDAPLIGVVSRLVDQKGIDLLIPALRVLCAESDTQVVVLGSGENYLENALWHLGNEFSNRVKVYTYYDPILAQRIYASSDLIVMPSRYEPCGTAQMIAQRYGALPVVRETGGLADTVDNYDNAAADTGTGFRFLWESPDAVLGTLRWAYNTYRNHQAAFQRMQERGMRRDWSWNTSAQQYIQLYEQAIAQKRSWQR